MVGILVEIFRVSIYSWILQLALSFSDSPYYYSHWCDDEGSQSLQYLDDKYCKKVFPGSFDRSWTCPISLNNDTGLDPEVWASDNVPLDEAPIDTTTLPNLGVRQDVQACLFLIKRIASNNETDSGLRTRRLCSGGGEKTSFETWSSSKFLAMGNAGGKLREECSVLGLEASTVYAKTSSNTVETPLGDLATVVASYDTTAGLTSNSVSSYFHDLGWRERAYQLAQQWLRVGDTSAAASASLGGNYGEATPAGLGFELDDDGVYDDDGMHSKTLPSTDGNTCSASPDPSDDGPYANSLTALAFAEAHRRVALHREVQTSQLQLPNATWQDVAHILYGAETSVLFPEVQWGGLSTDPAIYIQSALETAMETIMDVDDDESALFKMDDANNGTWRIFSKLGAGYSSSRNVGEIVTAGYGCIPFTQQNSNDGRIGDISGGGYEFTIAARSSVALDYDLSGAESVLIDAVTSIIGAMVEGKL